MMRHVIITLWILLLVLSFSGQAQTSFNVVIPGNPPGGIGGACGAATYAYLMPLTGGSQMATCSPSTHLWVAGGGGSGASPAGSNGQLQVKASSTTFGAITPFYAVDAYGLVGDGSTNNSSAIATLLSTVNTAGGGTICFTPGLTYRFTSQILLPNDAATQPNQNNIWLSSCGAGGPAWYGTVGAILDIRNTAVDGNAKIETRGKGTLGIVGLTIQDGGSTNATPLVHSTNTTLIIDASTFIGSGNVGQDAIVLGGTGTTLNGTVSAPFQGYGTKITRNHFRALNRGLYGLNYVNGVVFSQNSFQANVGTIAIELDGSNGAGQVDYGNTFADNLIEMDVYVNGFKFTSATENLLTGNGMYDPGSAVTGYYNFAAGSTQNKIICGTSPVSKTFITGITASLQATTVICSESGMSDATGNGEASNTFAYGAVVRARTYTPANVYPGGLTVTSIGAPTEVAALDYDHANSKAVLTSKINTTLTPWMIRGTFTGVGPTEFTATHTLDVYDATASTGATQAFFKAGSGQANLAPVVVNFSGSVNNLISIGLTGANGIVRGATNSVGTTWQITTDATGAGGASNFDLGSGSGIIFSSTAAAVGGRDTYLGRCGVNIFCVGAAAAGVSTGKVQAHFNSSDGTAGVTGATCTAWKDGLCTTL